MWIILVWIVSTICYLPMHFEKLGYAVPNVLIQAKYLFIIVPLVFSLVCVKRRISIKKWLRDLFVQRVGIEAFILCGVIAGCGILCTSIVNKEVWKDSALLFGAVYLFCMATLEEVAWRGFRFDALLQKQTARIAIFIVSLEWAVWHIPMWVIRNGIGLPELIFWLIYTIIVGYILGKCKVRYKNIVVPILLHTIFNVCFLLPIKISVIVVFAICVGVELVTEKGKLFQKK